MSQRDVQDEWRASNVDNTSRDVHVSKGDVNVVFYAETLRGACHTEQAAHSRAIQLAGKASPEFLQSEMTRQRSVGDGHAAGVPGVFRQLQSYRLALHSL